MKISMSELYKITKKIIKRKNLQFGLIEVFSSPGSQVSECYSHLCVKVGSNTETMTAVKIFY